MDFHGIAACITDLSIRSLPLPAAGNVQVTVNELNAYPEIAVPELAQKYKRIAQYPASYGFGNDFPVEVSNRFL